MPQSLKEHEKSKLYSKEQNPHQNLSKKVQKALTSFETVFGRSLSKNVDLNTRWLPFTDVIRFVLLWNNRNPTNALQKNVWNHTNSFIEAF